MRTSKPSARTGGTRPTRSMGCTMETLAKSSLLHMQSCAHCHTVSLHFGPITLRFDPGSLESVWNTLGEGLAVLHAQRAEEEGILELVRGREPGSA